MKLGGEIGREPAVQLLPVDLPSDPGQLPGDFTVLSVLVVRRDVGDDFHANRFIQGISHHGRPSLSPVDSSGGILYPLSGKCKFLKPMKDGDWLGKDDEALERILVERWLYRGAMLAVMLLAAIISTYLGVQGVTTLADMVTVGALLALAVAAAVVAFVMRLADLRIHREIRRRRSPR